MTKNGKPQLVPLMVEALEAIDSQRGKHPEWVFPGRGSTGHIVNPYRSWGRLAESAGLKDVRKHDLRRTLGSWQANTGASLQVIAKTLGHSSTRVTEAVYARLQLGPVREAMEKGRTGNAMRRDQKPGDKPGVVALDETQLALLAKMVAANIKTQEVNHGP